MINYKVRLRRSSKRYNLPVIGHFKDKSVRFNSILEAERVTGICYYLIFEACIGKLYKARNVYWEFEKGNHFIKYKAHYIRMQQKLNERGGDNEEHKSHSNH